MADAAHAHDHAAPEGAPSRAKVLLREPLVLNHRNYSWITNKIAGVVENPQPKVWWLIFIPCFLLTMGMVGCFTYLIATGVGVWGPNNPAAWGWDITNFVFWIGIGHAGTLISAILYLTRQKWRVKKFSGRPRFESGGFCCPDQPSTSPACWRRGGSDSGS